MDISREILYNLYITKGMKRKEVAEYLNLPELKVKYLLADYNIKKDKDAIKKACTKVNIPKEDLYRLYIEYNLNERVLSEIYKVTKGTISHKLEEYGIIKSKEQKKLATIKYNISKYGTEHPAQSNRVKEKQKQTNLKKYGSVSCLQNEKVNKKSRETMVEKYGTEYFPMSDKYKETLQERYDIDNVYQLENVKDKIKETLQERYGVDNPSKSKEIRSKSIKTSKSTRSKIDGKKFDSAYERDLYDFCLRNNIPIEDTQIPIDFEYNGKSHRTFIDFKIDGYLIECKGSHLLEGVFDYKQEVPIEKKLEIYKQNHVIIVTNKSGLFPKAESEESNGLRYLNKCPYPLIGIDIELFKNPEFPYKEDKPKCFYNVRVDNNLSPIEAWTNEKLRWKMIKNRIEYVGGFIDNKAILKAMNITRTCKQPSWFSKKYAKDLIQKYITTDIILDPFAGWGTRCDAAKELNKKYYGWDLNKELVDWHHEKGRLFDIGYGIEYGDANNIKTTRENCSIFICPPYTNFEIYFDGQDLKTTQCEWLQIVMNNIPNAKEYLMVCKVVDEGFEKYIVEEKVNKSHLGTNKEYVLLIKNDSR